MVCRIPCEMYPYIVTPNIYKEAFDCNAYPLGLSQRVLYIKIAISGQAIHRFERMG